MNWAKKKTGGPKMAKFAKAVLEKSLPDVNDGKKHVIAEHL